MAKVPFTAGRVNGFACPPGKQQAFLWDRNTPGLGLRVTPNGTPSFIFQGRFNGADLRIVIGSPSAWSISNAQAKARELQRQIDEGRDPRELKRAALAALAAKRSAERAQQVAVGEAWAAYLADRRPFWGDRHYADHLAMVRPAGRPANRGTRGRAVTIAGPLHCLMDEPLAGLTPQRITRWASSESKSRPTVARLAWRLLRAFASWCAEQPAYRSALPDGNPVKSRRAREILGRPGVKRDALQREQLAAWFAAVRAMPNATVAAYVQAVLLTGARPGEVLALAWDDLDFRWRTITIRDKVEGTRVIPMTPYIEVLLHALPRTNRWLFASTRVLDQDPANVARRARAAKRNGRRPVLAPVAIASKSGRISIPSAAARRVCEQAGIEPPVTLHGLRRSFGTLAEWVEVPAGVVAQLMGHKPSATAEKHYRARPLDLLRLWAVKIEAWTLDQAGIEQPAAGAVRLTAVRRRS